MRACLFVVFDYLSQSRGIHSVAFSPRRDKIKFITDEDFRRFQTLNKNGNDENESEGFNEDEVVSSKGRTLLLLIGIWVVCLGYCSLPFIHITPHPFLDMCVENWYNGVRRGIFSVSLTFFFYLLPLVVICICYASMAKVLWNAGSEISNNRSGAARRQSRRKIARMVLVLVVCFACCWLPYHTRVLIEILKVARNNSFYFYFFCARALAYFNSCLNPLLYSFLGENFRSQMKDVFFCFPALSLRKEGPSITTALHEIDGSRRGNNNSADTQMTYAGHTKMMTSKPL
ncbi:putative galanin receptor type 1-like [Apostichopus japonicus]|uniref:Putative galanin receptor type 1-like n=1 Tax=Stichopus japonicus TaxID=307972 RepID=A0A2G8LJW1_STIJA|nr:putative galanin receptor type 1-like [Apostichopus japonicus]